MFFRFALATALFLGGTLAASAQQGTPVSQQEARRTAETLISRFDAAYNRHDAAEIASLFTEDGKLVPSRPSVELGAVLSGRQQIEKFFANAFATFANQTQKVVDAGSVGDSGIWLITELRLSGPGTKGPKQVDGHVGGLLVRNGNTWLIRMSTATTHPPEQTTAEAPVRR